MKMAKRDIDRLISLSKEPNEIPLVIRMGLTIKRLRIEARLNQRTMEVAGDLTQTSLSRFETCQLLPSIGKLEAICDALDIKMGYFFTILETTSCKGFLRVNARPRYVIEKKGENKNGQTIYNQELLQRNFS